MSSDEKILDAAVRVFAEVGYRAATTRRIATEAGVNEVTLFRRFGNKERLAFAALRRHAELHPFQPLPTDPIDPEAELVAWAREHMAHLVHNRALFGAVISEMEGHPELCASASAPAQQLAGELAGYLDRVRERGLGHGAWDARVAASMLMGALFADALGRGVMERHSLSPEDAAAAYARLFAAAIGATRSPETPR